MQNILYIWNSLGLDGGIMKRLDPPLCRRSHCVLNLPEMVFRSGKPPETSDLYEATPVWWVKTAIIQPVFVTDVQLSSSSCPAGFRQFPLFRSWTNNGTKECCSTAKQRATWRRDSVFWLDEMRPDRAFHLQAITFLFCFFLNNTQPSNCKKWGSVWQGNTDFTTSKQHFIAIGGENITILLSDKSDFFHFLTFSICFWLSTFWGGSFSSLIELDQCFRFVFIVTLRLTKLADLTTVSTLFAVTILSRNHFEV